MIKDVLLLGSKSSNAGAEYSGREYLPRAMASAVPLLEGAKSYANHATESEMAERRGNRDVRDFIGVYRGVHHVEEAGEIRGDYHLVAGELGDRFLDMAERFPQALGLSIDAEGHGYVDDRGILCVEALTAVHSVDLVDNPRHHDEPVRVREPASASTTRTGASCPRPRRPRP